MPASRSACLPLPPPPALLIFPSSHPPEQVTVILKNVFSPEELVSTPGLKEELEGDVKGECAKLGKLEKVGGAQGWTTPNTNAPGQGRLDPQSGGVLQALCGARAREQRRRALHRLLAPALTSLAGPPRPPARSCACLRGTPRA